ncbi:hypothetical protein ACS5PU_14055 [Pedobacter sp. GSP4]|uniref:hypothetical protein n=1 Tax=Pedobacter sp. GSP4 TaxID=3453716 RepID=UPI003EEE957E
MLVKEIGILLILSHAVLKMPAGVNSPITQINAETHQESKSARSESGDTTKRKNTVYVKDIKYTRDNDSRTFAQITIKNTTKETITDISFRLDGDVTKGCNNAYDLKKQVKLKPNQSIIFTQLLAENDCEMHVVKNIRIKFIKHITFTLD